MTKRKVLTDDDINSRDKNHQHIRRQCIDYTITVLIIVIIATCGLTFLVAVVRGASIYMKYIENPKSVNPNSVELITTIFTHLIAALGGYGAHLFNRVSGMPAKA